MPNAKRPKLVDKGTGEEKFFHSDDVWGKLRLSSKSHWDVSIQIHGTTLHILAAHPTPPVFDAVAALGIGGLAVLMAAVVVWLRTHYEHVSLWPTSVVIGGWMLVTALLARTGLLARVDLTPAPFAVMLPLIFAVPIAVALSPLGGRLAAALPIPALVGLQMFRLPLELVMHHAADLGIMPPELSYSGYNLDIVTGTAAAVLFLALRLAAVPRSVVWVWNVWGLWCLAVIAWVARSGSPLVRAFGDDPRHVNTWVLYFPYVWLPTVLVMIALSGHLVLTRALLRPARHA